MTQVDLSIYSERGIGKLTFLVFGSIAAVVLFCAYNVVPFYYYYYELQNQFEAVVKVADVDNDKVIRRKLMYHINKMKLPVEEEDLKITREGRHIKIELRYQEIFYITYKGKDYDLRTFDFYAHAESDY